MVKAIKMSKVFPINDEDLRSIESISLQNVILKPCPNEIRGNGDSQTEADTYLQKTLDSAIHPNDAEVSLEVHIDRNNENILNGEINTVSIIESCMLATEGLEATESLNEEDGSMKISLDEEKSYFENKARKRDNTFKEIIQNAQIALSLKEGFVYSFAIPLIGISSTIILTLIPAHDLVKSPEYWYEILFHDITGPLMWGVPFVCVKVGTLLNIKYTYAPKNISFMFLVASAASLVILLASYYLWTPIFEYHYPIPFLVFLYGFFMNGFFLLVIWLRFPFEWRKNGELQRRMKAYCLFILFSILLAISYQIIIDKIRRSDVDYQHFVALALPAIREISIWMGSKWIARCVNGDEKGAIIFLKYSMTTTHTITLCYVIGSYTTITTSWVLMGVDFLCNVFICLWVVWTKKFHPHKIRKQIDLLQDLAIYELVEFHATFAFIFVIAMAYYGPNASILGNIGNSYWAYTAIVNIDQTLVNMGIFFLIDFSSTMLSASILWTTCRISLWHVFLELQKEFGKWFSLTLGNALVLVSKYEIYSFYNLL